MLSRTRLVLSQIPPNTSKTSKSDQLGLAGWRASVDNLLTSVLKTTLSSLPSSTLTSTLSSLSYVPSRNVEKASEALSISQQIANEKIKEVQKKIVEVEELREEDKVMLDQAVNDWKIAEKQKETYQSKLHTLQSTLANQTQTSTPESSTHPILGPLLLDLGYKKLYTPPISTLSSLPIWSKQRTFRPSRAHQIAQSKLKSKTGMPGIICLTEIESGGLKIVDGQHRVAALSIMESEGEKVDKVLVEVFTETRSNFAEGLFTEINRAEPVKFVDLPGTGITDNQRVLLEESVSVLKMKYEKMFSDSSRCIAPHVNEDNLRDMIYKCGVLEGVERTEELVGWLEECNERVGRRVKRGKVEAVGKGWEKKVEKAKANGFYLGLEEGWLKWKRGKK